MLITILAFITALSTSAIAMYFSVAGLVYIFAGAAVSVMIMGIILEIGKLVAVAWLHQNWNITPWWLKTYLLIAVFVLMVITSMGIFGALAKSHIEQGAPVVANVAKIERFDQRIAREQKKIDDAEQIVLQLDQAVQTLIDYDRIRGPEGSIAVRQSQKDERETLTTIINESQAVIDSFIDEKFELESSVRAFEVEIGPIKYVADMVYGDSDKQTLEKAVRWLILIIVFVFDPFAVLLLIAANYSLVQAGLKKAPKQVEEVVEEKVEEVIEEKVEETVAEPDVESEPEMEPEVPELVEVEQEVEEVPVEKVKEEYSKAKSDDEIKEAKGLRGKPLNIKGEL